MVHKVSYAKVGQEWVFCTQYHFLITRHWLHREGSDVSNIVQKTVGSLVSASPAFLESLSHSLATAAPLSAHILYEPLQQLLGDAAAGVVLALHQGSAVSPSGPPTLWAGVSISTATDLIEFKLPLQTLQIRNQIGN